MGICYGTLEEILETAAERDVDQLFDEDAGGAGGFASAVSVGVYD